MSERMSEAHMAAETLGHIDIQTDYGRVSHCSIRGDVRLSAARGITVQHCFVEGDLIVNGEKIDVAAIVAENRFAGRSDGR